jgi:hypothetical protein
MVDCDDESGDCGLDSSGSENPDEMENGGTTGGGDNPGSDNSGPDNSGSANSGPTATLKVTVRFLAVPAAITPAAQLIILAIVIMGSAFHQKFPIAGLHLFFRKWTMHRRTFRQAPPTQIRAITINNRPTRNSSRTSQPVLPPTLSLEPIVAKDVIQNRSRHMGMATYVRT